MTESFRKNKKGIMLMILSSLCVCVGQLFWKLAAEGNIFFLLIGFAIYGAGALIMIIAYRYGRLSVLQPVLSLNYVISVILAALVLGETITMVKCLGVAMIVLGVCMIAGGDGE